MQYISLQMVDGRISSDWWKALIKYFVKEGHTLQIRCWNEESEEIKQALRYGTSHVEGNETCIDGVVSADLLNELLYSPEPTDKSVYNKMTAYFTLRTTDGKKEFESAHYGTELYIVLSSEDAEKFHDMMAPYIDSFSIFIHDR